MNRKLDQYAVSKDGYIISQYKTDNVPYGCRTSNRHGCGWIAAYNFFRIVGDPRPVDELTSALIKRSLFRGRLGTSPFRLRRYLRRQGHQTRLSLTKKKAAERAGIARAGILLYRHKGGWHFVAFESAGGAGRLRFYNASQGEERHYSTMERFLKKENLAPLVFLITIPVS